MNKEVYIVSAVRTPIGTFGGSLSSFSATSLGGIAIKGALDKAGISKDLIDEVIMGSVIQAGLGQAPARQAAKLAGLPDKVICTTINKVCASGMKSIAMAAQNIMLGDADIIIAGGMESMSNVPYYNMSQRWGNKYGDIVLQDGLAKDGLVDVYDKVAMGNFADVCATKYNISRETQDTFAVNSYKKAQAAIENGWFKDEIVPVELQQKKGSAIIVDKDEEPSKVNFDKIPQLNPAFSKEGTVTAANASTMNDGAAAVVLMSSSKAKELDIKPIAIIKSFADAEQDPKWFTTTPSLALPKALKKANLNINDIQFFEFNEAFSVVGIVNTELLKIDPKKVNVHGGAVALGHPLGCSGARIIVSLIHILYKHKAKYGAAAICNGGGGASAMVIELL
ncbi:MAG: acetyl-CoA C-acyltransferase [Chitinophagia bacterium]|nr:acetyl-CoA C-acyltransferase [Chitinophagia bacterium]NDD16186.1 acetyl-CoA C-acyltransferase [Chitinophagia bacterium]